MSVKFSYFRFNIIIMKLNLRKLNKLWYIIMRYQRFRMIKRLKSFIGV